MSGFSTSLALIQILSINRREKLVSMIFGFQDDFRSKLLVRFLASNLHKWVIAGVLTFDIFEINENKYILTTAFPCLHGSFFATLFKAFGFHFALRLCTSC